MIGYKGDPNMNILVYGAPGSGKTHLAAEIASKRMTLLYDIDLGASTINKFPKEIKDNLVILQHTEFADLNKIYQMLLKNNTAEKWNQFFAQNKIDIKIDRPFEVIILDSISELQRHMERELSATTLSDKMSSIQNIKPLRIQDWGAVSDLTESVVADAFGRLPLVFVATAHEQMIENENMEEVFGTPKLRGKLAFDIGKHFDLMGRLTTAKTGQRVLYTKPEKKWQAKSREKTDGVIVNPNLNKIIEENE